MLLDPDRPGLEVCESVSLSAQCSSSINPPPVHEMLLRVDFEMCTAQEHLFLVACMFTDRQKKTSNAAFGVESMINKSSAIV